MRAFSDGFLLLAALVLLGLAPATYAHGDDGDMNMETEMETASMAPPLNATMMGSNSTAPLLPSYFRHPEYSSLMLAHIVLMSLAWIFVLPLGVMLQIARSRLGLPVQFAFLALNAVGVLIASIYKNMTPDLYAHNAHNTIGWLLTWVVIVQTCLALVSTSTSMRPSKNSEDQVSFLPISSDGLAEHQFHDLGHGSDYRFSNDSGHGTDHNTESSRSQPSSSMDQDERVMDHVRQKYEADDENARSVELDSHKRGLSLSNLDGVLSKLPSYLSSRAIRLLGFFEAVITRTVLILGFIGITTGLITYGGLFRGMEIFSGLAHFIKGGVFFWYGILTLGRWAGCFADLGWAWNIKPPASVVGPRKASAPSAEFIESFLIFFYGSTNIFLEHLGEWGGEWSAQDLEHISITVMFIGGGLCGMLIESHKIRDLLNVNLTQSWQGRIQSTYSNNNESEFWQPKSYGFSMNPIPALVILLLGMMMSSHHQQSMVSTMVHKQWGNLLMGASFSRTLTYIIFYLSPPTSLLPSRPPSELITAFCLMAGGVIFMASSHDTVLAMEYNDLGAMFVFTVAMGFITLLMAWIIFAIAIKGWASRQDRRSPF